MFPVGVLDLGDKPGEPHMPQLNIPVLPNCFDLTTATQKTTISWGPQSQAASGFQNCGLSASISHKSVDFSVHTPGEELQAPQQDQHHPVQSIPACGSTGSIPSHPNPLIKLPSKSSQSGSYVFKIIPSP